MRVASQTAVIQASSWHKGCLSVPPRGALGLQTGPRQWLRKGAAPGDDSAGCAPVGGWGCEGSAGFPGCSLMLRTEGAGCICGERVLPSPAGLPLRGRHRFPRGQGGMARGGRAGT